MVFIRKKKIGNNYYYYSVRSVRTGPNTWKKYEKYIGKVKPTAKDKYDIIIIGAGPAGLFAAYELSKNKNLKVLVIEKGKDIRDRKKNIMSGIGGAGLFSDGKLNLTAVHGKTNLYEFVSKTEANKLIDYIDKVFIKFGASTEYYTKNLKEAEKIRKKAKKYDIDLLILKQKHIGSDKLPLLISKFVNFLKNDKIEFSLNTEVIDIVTRNNKIYGVKLANGSIIKTKSIIACPGRVGSKWFMNQSKKLGIPLKHRGIEVGIRVEVKAKIMKPITDIIWDPAFFIKTKRIKDIVRTFCTCPYGYVAKETYHGFIAVNGYCRLDKKSKNTNFALLSNVELTQPATDTIAYGESIGSLATTIAAQKPFIQRWEDLKKYRRSYWYRINKSKVKPTLKDVTPGDLTMAIPCRVVENLFYALKQLNKLIPGLTKDTLIYGPELKFFSVRIKTNKNLETNVKNLFVAGDGAGLCGNIVGAAATGVIAARSILNKIRQSQNN